MERGIETTALILFLLSILGLALNVALAEPHEPPATEWSKTYGGAGDEVPWSLVQTSDGGYALAGWTNSSGAGDRDFWLVKTDWTGNMQWNKTYGGANWDTATSVVQTSDGGYALAGYTYSFGAGDENVWLVKTDSFGNMLWNQTYGTTGYDTAWCVVQTSDGGYALAGYTWPDLTGNDRNFWLVKTDSLGNMLWNQTYGWTGRDEARSLVQTSDGGYALAGYIYSYGAGGNDIWLVKTDSAGNMQWNKTYGGARGDANWGGLVQTSDGGYALAGYTYSFGAAGLTDFWLVRTDSAGNMLWNQTYGGTGLDVPYSMVQTSDGGYVLTGYTNSSGAGYFDFWLVKADSVGTMLWNRTYGGTNYEGARSVIQTSDGGYALTGETNSFGAGGYDFWLVKIAPEVRPPPTPVPEFSLATPLATSLGTILLITAQKLVKRKREP